jgi:hypothetical protein
MEHFMTLRGTLVLLAGLALAAPCPLPAGVRPMLAGDPNLDPAWDWTTHTTHLLYMSQAGERPSAITAKLPFDTPDNPLYSETPDMAREDGWMLVHRDFGTSEAAPPLPYFTLYNRYRGTFRVMLFNGLQRDDSYYLGELAFLDGAAGGGHAAGLLTFPNRERGTLATYDPAQRVLATSRMKRYHDWAVFDFPLAGFDPGLERKDPILVFRLSGIATSRITLDGRNDPDLVHATLGTRISPGAALTGGGLRAIGERGYRYYKGVRDWLEEFTRGGNSAENHKLPFYDQIMSLSRTRVASFAPYAGALLGVLETFIGGVHEAGPWEVLGHKGQLAFHLEGGLEATRELWAASFYLRPGPGHIRALRPVQRIPWGIFNLDGPPRLEAGADPNPALKAWRLAEGGRVLVNPEAGMTLQSVHYALEYQLSGQGRAVADPETACSPFLAAGAFQASGTVLRAQAKPSAVMVQLRFQVDAPTRALDRELMIMKKVPVLVNTLD